jgi:GGDEF domain-containing protein
MSKLKLSITFMISYVILVLGIANIDEFQESVVDFNPEFFIIVAGVIVSGIIITGYLIQAGVRLSNYIFISFWLVAYLFVWVFYFESTRPIEVQLIQLLLVLVSAGLSYDVGKRIGQLDKALNDFSFGAYPNRARDVQEAGGLISAEIARARRYHHPLSVLVINVNLQKNKPTDKKLDALQMDILERFATAKISQILSDFARNTDMILRDKDGQFILICPETDIKNISILARRIEAAVDENLDARVYWGGALFPDEALTFDDLVQTAKERIDQSRKPETQYL